MALHRVAFSLVTIVAAAAFVVVTETRDLKPAR